MHAPDGFLNAATAVTTGVLSVGAVGYAMRQSSSELKDKQVPLAGISAAFVFAAQMFNFPVAAGTTGHLLGGCLAAILLGPSVGAVVVAVVVLVQALVFADGGLTALGYNTLNMAVVTSFGGYAVFSLLRRVLPRTQGGIVGAAALAGGASVVLSSMAFSIEWLFGATAPVPFDTVFGAMVGVHLLIGIGEGIITGMAVGAVIAARPDLVHGVRDLEWATLRERSKVSMRVFVVAGLAVTLVLATVVSQFAGSAPDGLESVAADQGFLEQGRDSAVADSIFADYATDGLADERASLAVAGATGTLITLMVGLGLASTMRRGRDRATAG